MQQKRLFLSAILMIALINSCKKDKNKEPATTTYPNYSQLKVGNYWIYEQFDIDTTGNVTSNNKFDSCYVEKDTIINSQTYFKLVKPNPFNINVKVISFQKDSLHYVVNSNGYILFSSQDFSTIFQSYYFTAGLDTICQVTKQMGDKNLLVTTPSGTYTTSTSKETFSMFPGWTSAGNPRFINTKYAQNIGIAIETLPFFSSNPNYTERRLVRYHLN